MGTQALVVSQRRVVSLHAPLQQSLSCVQMSPPARQ
jgi:hypothetical protein